MSGSVEQIARESVYGLAALNDALTIDVLVGRFRRDSGIFNQIDIRIEDVFLNYGTRSLSITNVRLKRKILAS